MSPDHKLSIFKSLKRAAELALENDTETAAAVLNTEVKPHLAYLKTDLSYFASVAMILYDAIMDYANDTPDADRHHIKTLLADMLDNEPEE